MQMQTAYQIYIKSDLKQDMCLYVAMGNS